MKFLELKKAIVEMKRKALARAAALSIEDANNFSIAWAKRENERMAESQAGKNKKVEIVNPYHLLNVAPSGKKWLDEATKAAMPKFRAAFLRHLKET